MLINRWQTSSLQPSQLFDQPFDQQNQPKIVIFPSRKKLTSNGWSQYSRPISRTVRKVVLLISLFFCYSQSFPRLQCSNQDGKSIVNSLSRIPTECFIVSNDIIQRKIANLEVLPPKSHNLVRRIHKTKQNITRNSQATSCIEYTHACKVINWAIMVFFW